MTYILTCRSPLKYFFIIIIVIILLFLNVFTDKIRTFTEKIANLSIYEGDLTRHPCDIKNAMKFHKNVDVQSSAFPLT